MGHAERGKKLNMAVGMLDHSAGISKACGAEVVVFHPGFLLGRCQMRDGTATLLQPVLGLLDELVEVGEGVTGFAIGDAVFGNTVAGGYAEYAVLPASVTAQVPDGLSFTDAAVLPVGAFARSASDCA